MSIVRREKSISDNGAGVHRVHHEVDFRSEAQLGWGLFLKKREKDKFWDVNYRHMKAASIEAPSVSHRVNTLMEIRILRYCRYIKCKLDPQGTI